jgi:hypothetical protein
MQSVDFVGVKLGDINSDAKSNLTGETEIFSRGGGVTLRTGNKSFDKNEVFELTISSNEFGELEAMQFALEIDRDAVEVLQIQSMHSGHGLDIINKAEEFGIVSALWYGAEPLEAPGLFRIRLRALQDGSTEDVLTLKEGATCYAYLAGSDQPQLISLEYSEDSGVQDTQTPEQVFMKVGPNTPNPFGTETRFIVELAEDSPLHIAVVSPDGRILYTELVDGIAGLQEIVLNANQMNATGVVFCRVTAGEVTALMRMVINTVY